MAGANPRVRLILTPVLKLVIAVVGLLILQALVSAFPMVQEVPVPSRLPLSVSEILRVMIDTVILVLLINFVFEIGDNLEALFPAFPQGGVIVKWLSLLVAILIAYGAYRALARTFLSDYVWIYPLVFLALALIPLLNLVLLSYHHIDRLIDMAETGVLHFKTEEGMSQAKRQLQCANCGTMLHPGVKFCRMCGTASPVQNIVEASLPRCSQCSATLSPGSKFCPECGTRT